MFGLGDNDNEERMWNFVLFKFYATDEEMSNLSPIIGILLVVVIILIIGGLCLFFS